MLTQQEYLISSQCIYQELEFTGEMPKTDNVSSGNFICHVDKSCNTD